MRRGTIRRIEKCLKGQRMDQNVLYFFDREPEALPLYEVFEEKVLSEGTLQKMRVGSTAINLESLDPICELLQCQVGDLVEWTPGKSI